MSKGTAMQDKVPSVQDKMMSLVGRIKLLQNMVMTGQDLQLVTELNEVAVDLENLTAEFPAMQAYELKIKGIDEVQDDGLETIHTVLPKMIGDLAISSKQKPAYARTVREAAAANLLPVAVEEIFEITYAQMPLVKPRNVEIRAI